nr:cytochrome p450 78a7 [Quercus suber]
MSLKSINKLGVNYQGDHPKLMFDSLLQEDDMVVVLWEMIFRGIDTTTLLTEWVMAELILHPEVQEKLYKEIDSAVGNKAVTDADVALLPYLPFKESKTSTKSALSERLLGQRREP